MTKNQRRRYGLHPRAHGLSAALEAIDRQWREYKRYVFRICVDYFSPSDDFALFALSVAEDSELLALKDLILEKAETFGLHASIIEELHATVADGSEPPTPFRLRQIFHSAVRHSETVYPVIVRFVADHFDDGISHPPLPTVLDEIATVFSLDRIHARIIAALFLTDDSEAFSTLMRQGTHRRQLQVLTDIAETDLPTFIQETAPGSTLERLGLIGFNGGRDEITDVNVNRSLLFALRSNSISDLQAGLFDGTPDPRYGIEEFTLSPAEVRTCSSALRGGYPLLISGEPGIGKTEFARSIIDSLKRNARTLATASRRSMEFNRGAGRADGESGRLSSLRLAVNLLNPSTDVLIIDEADTILQSATGFFDLFSGGGTYDKARLNHLLDHLPAPTIWITNEHRMIPASALRRFGHVLAFPHPTIETRVRMLTDRFAPLAACDGADCSGTATPNISEWTRDLAAGYDITPAAIDRAARIISSELDARHLTPDAVRDRVTGYIAEISTGALAQDVRRLPTVSTSFDPRFCSTSEPLDRVERQALHRAQAGGGLRLLFGGPPGGGKTQYALWLAKRLRRDVVLKRPSDLLSKYIGDSEKQIAAAFRAAARSGSVLIIDEADALLYDRSIAVRSWEHTQIAEFLQQIQEYTGILIACTNRVDAVDAALRRRFHSHVTFGSVSDEILPDALAHIFPEVAFTAKDLAALRQGPPLMMSDLAGAAEMVEIDGLEPPERETGAVPETSAASIIVREILAGARSRDRTREIGF